MRNINNFHIHIYRNSSKHPNQLLHSDDSLGDIPEESDEVQRIRTTSSDDDKSEAIDYHLLETLGSADSDVGKARVCQKKW